MFNQLLNTTTFSATNPHNRLIRVNYVPTAQRCTPASLSNCLTASFGLKSEKLMPKIQTDRDTILNTGFREPRRSQPSDLGSLL